MRLVELMRLRNEHEIFFCHSGHVCGVGMRSRERRELAAQGCTAVLRRLPAWAQGGGARVRDVGRGHAKETRLGKTLSAAPALETS